MKLKIVGLQSGPYRTGDSYANRIEQLSAHFDLALQNVPDADLIIFPELMTTPYFCKVYDKKFFEFAEPLDGKTFQFFSKKAKDSGVYIIITIFEKCVQNHKISYFNTAILISDSGKMIGFYRKTHIPKISLKTLTTDESFYFERGTQFPVFDIKGIKVGILICFDRSFPEASRALALQGAEAIVIPTAAGGEERKNVWLLECQARARENGLYVVGVNKAGEEVLEDNGREIKSSFFGLSCAFDPSGKEVKNHLDSKPWQFLQLEIDHQKVEKYRSKLNHLNFLQVDLYYAYSQELQKIRNYNLEKETVPLFEPKGVVAID